MAVPENNETDIALSVLLRQYAWHMSQRKFATPLCCVERCKDTRPAWPFYLSTLSDHARRRISTNFLLDMHDRGWNSYRRGVMITASPLCMEIRKVFVWEHGCCRTHNYLPRVLATTLRNACDPEKKPMRSFVKTLFIKGSRYRI